VVRRDDVGDERVERVQPQRGPPQVRGVEDAAADGGDRQRPTGRDLVVAQPGDRLQQRRLPDPGLPADPDVHGLAGQPGLQHPQQPDGLRSALPGVGERQRQRVAQLGRRGGVRAQRLDGGGQGRELLVDRLPARHLGADAGQQAAAVGEDARDPRLGVGPEVRSCGAHLSDGRGTRSKRYGVATSPPSVPRIGNVVAMAPTARVFPARPLQALTTILSFTAVLWVVEFYDQLTGERLDQDGIVPRSVDGLEGILWAPLLHGGWAHLIANTLPFVIFGFLVLANGVGRFVFVTAVIWVLAGLGVWFTAPDGSVTVGMSGVIFGWLTYLLVRGFFARSGGQIVLALVVFFLWGGILLGVLPGQEGVSWQGHLFGALAGVLAAWLVARRSRPAPSPTNGTFVG